MKKSYFWGLYSTEYSIGYSSVPPPPPPPHAPEREAVEMIVVGINRHYPANQFLIDLVPASMRLKNKDDGECIKMPFEIGQMVKVNIQKG